MLPELSGHYPASLYAYSYIARHIETGELYVGSALNYIQRRASHFSELKNGKHRCPRWQEVWNRDPDRFKWQWFVLRHDTREQAFAEEQRLLDQYKDDPLLLNAVYNARSPISGVVARPGYRKHLDEKNRTRPKKTPEELEIIRRNRTEGARRRWSSSDRRLARSGALNPSSKTVFVKGQQFGSTQEAARAIGISKKTIRRRAMDAAFPHYSFDPPESSQNHLPYPTLEEDEATDYVLKIAELSKLGKSRKLRSGALPSLSQVVVVDDQEYPSINAAARALHRAPVSIRRLAEDPNCTTTYFREPT